MSRPSVSMEWCRETSNILTYFFPGSRPQCIFIKDSMKECVSHWEFQSDKAYHTHIVGLFICFIWQQLNMMKSPHANMESSSIFQGGILFPPAWSSEKRILQHFTGSHGCWELPRDTRTEHHLWSAGRVCWVSLLLGYCLISSSVRRREQVLYQFSASWMGLWELLLPQDRVTCSKETSLKKDTNFFCCTVYRVRLLMLKRHQLEHLIRPLFNLLQHINTAGWLLDINCSLWNTLWQPRGSCVMHYTSKTDQGLVSQKHLTARMIIESILQPSHKHTLKQLNWLVSFCYNCPLSALSSGWNDTVLIWYFQVLHLFFYGAHFMFIVTCLYITGLIQKWLQNDIVCLEQQLNQSKLTSTKKHEL